MNRDELRGAVVEALAGVADQLPEAGEGERLDVRGTSHLGPCPAAIALDGDAPFEPSPQTAAWTLASLATDRLVHGSTDPLSGARPADPAAALDLAVAEVTDDWAGDWWATATDAERAVAGGDVARRVAALARMASTWPLPPPVRVGHRRTWSFPGRSLRLCGRVDLVFGGPADGRRLVVVLGGDHGATTRSRLAYEALVDALAAGRPAAAVVGVLPDAGRRWRIAVDDTVLAEGITAAAGAARAALGARRRDAAGVPRRPGPRCRACAHATGCDDGGSWLAGPGRLQAGFLRPA